MRIEKYINRISISHQGQGHFINPTLALMAWEPFFVQARDWVHIQT